MEATETSSPIRLMTNLMEGGQSSSVIPLRWCVSREVVEELKEQGITNLQLLLTITNGSMEVERRLVPLNAEMAYIRFRSPGRNVVHATIVWSTSMRSKSLEGILLGVHGLDYRGYPRYMWEVMAYDKSHFHTDIGMDIMRHLGEDQFEVIVPEEMFAKEPPKWLQRFVGLFFKSRKIDQCDFRKRVTLSALATPPYAVYLVAMQLVKLGAIVVMLFVGRRGINYWPLIQPIHTSPKDTWRNVHSSFWIETRSGDVSPLAVFNPPVIAISYLIAFWVTTIWANASFKGDKLQEQHLDHLWGGTWWFYLIPTLGLATVVAVAFLLGEVLPAAIAALFSKTANTSVAEQAKTRLNAKRRERRQEAERRAVEAKKALYSELEAMACNGPKTADLRDLPKEHRTVVLRFQAIKAAVCRPYAR